MLSNYTAMNIYAIGNIVSGNNGRLVLMAGTMIALGSLYCYQKSSEETKQVVVQNLGAILGKNAVEPVSVITEVPIEESNPIDDTTSKGGEVNG